MLWYHSISSPLLLDLPSGRLYFHSNYAPIMPSSDDLYIHEYRFADWMPSPIKSLAVDTFSGMVATGREDGTVEVGTYMKCIHYYSFLQLNIIQLTNPGGKWYNQARVYGRSNFHLSGLVFSRVESHSGRLFGSSMNGFLFEVCYSSLYIPCVSLTLSG